MTEITITDANFEQEVLLADKPVLVDFWAAWCAPCQMLAPAIVDIAKKYEGIVKVGKINVDEQMELAMRFQIASIPTVMLFENGKAVKTLIGVQPQETIEALLPKKSDSAYRVPEAVTDIDKGYALFQKAPRGTLLIDVRTEEEYREGHLPGSINHPLQRLAKIEETVPNKDTPAFVYCFSGARSGRSVAFLKKIGYTNVVNIGGIHDYHGTVEQ